MAAPMLFPNQQQGAAGAPRRPSALVEFRAGRCYLNDKTVTSDKRKGQVQVNVEEDGILHLSWRDRTTGVVEEEAMLFPGSAEYKVVPQCTTGRVYVLKFIGSSRRMFFWMQEPKDDKDEEYARKINEYINNPPPFGAGAGGAGAGGGAGGDLGGMFPGGLGGLEQNQLLELLAQQHGVTGLDGIGNTSADNSADNSSGDNSTAAATPLPINQSADSPVATMHPGPDSLTTPDAAGTPAAPPPLLPAGLAAMLSGAGGAAGGAAGGGSGGPSLNDVISPEEVIPLLEDPQIRQALQPLLPETGSAEDIAAAVRSPQFRQMLASLSQALQSGDPASQALLMTSFGLNPEGPGIEAFLKAVQEAHGKKQEDKKNDDDKMDTS
eukprot:TRINITY_DN644_c0_g1_i2.p1 TRINITY_DN644_c0_g1~~TRINITY_DN644_c0_g1_i2.p1  ORF type:complete len:380 (-),score=135.49 TRINITY_DN644_c0_g1_i2:133-1272(-)